MKPKEAQFLLQRPIPQRKLLGNLQHPRWNRNGRCNSDESSWPRPQQHGPLEQCGIPIPFHYVPLQVKIQIYAKNLVFFFN